MIFAPATVTIDTYSDAGSWALALHFAERSNAAPAVGRVREGLGASDPWQPVRLVESKPLHPSESGRSPTPGNTFTQGE